MDKKNAFSPYEVTPPGEIRPDPTAIMGGGGGVKIFKTRFQNFSQIKSCSLEPPGTSQPTHLLVWSRIKSYNRDNTGPLEPISTKMAKNCHFWALLALYSRYRYPNPKNKNFYESRKSISNRFVFGYGGFWPLLDGFWGRFGVFLAVFGCFKVL